VREKVLRYIREHDLIRPGDRVAVAVSGGADSVALLHASLELRPELGIVLAVTHFNHGLREQAVADEAFVANLAEQHGLEFFAGRADVREHASANKLSVEAAGRELRYQWFEQLAHDERLNSIATAHTLDDQAETALLKFVRGAGTRGLAGIFPERQVESCGEQRRSDSARIIRPLLSITRAEVEAYLTSSGQSWREDETNLDRRFLRNRIRHDLLPLLEREYNPNLRQLLSNLSDLSRAEEDYWAALVEAHLARHTASGQLLLGGFAALPLAMQRRVIRCFAEQHPLTLDFEQVERLRQCALGEVRRTELPGGRIAVNQAGCLRVCELKPTDVRKYSYVLPVPGEVRILELDITLRAQVVTQEFAREFPSGTLLKRDLLGEHLTIRNWMPGDRFHPAHQRSEEKLKRLFAEEKILAEQRRTWPVGLHNGEIVWVQGFSAAAAYAWKGEGEAVTIESIS